jgi:uncharacterized protein (TIGR04222 family)
MSTLYKHRLSLFPDIAVAPPVGWLGHVNRYRRQQTVIETRVDDVLSSVELSPLEAAYLAQGVPRVIGASLAGLAQMGLIQVRSDRTVVPLQPAPTSLQDPILRKVVSIVSTSVRPSSVKDIRNGAEPATWPVRAALRAAGLLLDERALWTGGLAILGAGLAAFVGFLVLVAASGGNAGNAVVWGLFITFGPAVFLMRRLHRTRRGNAVLKRLQEDHAALKESTLHAPALLTPNDLAQAVAIYGPAILEGGALNVVGQALKRDRSNCGGCGGCGGCGCGGCGGCG